MVSGSFKTPEKRFTTSILLIAPSYSQARVTPVWLCEFEMTTADVWSRVRANAKHVQCGYKTQGERRT